MAQQKKMVENITSMEEDFCPVVHRRGEKSRADGLFQREGLHGHRALRLCPVGEHPGGSWTGALKKLGMQNVYMPHVHPRKPAAKGKGPRGGLCPRGGLGHPGRRREAARAPVRAPHHRRLCSASTMQKIIHSYRDLPKLYNQWCSRGALGKDHPPLPALRRNFCWQEGHTMHETAQEAHGRDRAAC